MNQTSQWPLTAQAIRYTTPDFMLRFLANSRLTRACYPTAFGYYPAASGHKMARQKPNDNLLIYCTEGEGHINTSSYSGSLNSGDLLLLPEGVAHEYRADRHNPWSIYWFHFLGLEARPLIESLDFQAQSPATHIGRQPILIGDLKRLIALRKSGYQYSVFTYAASITRQILCHLSVSIRNSKAVSRHNFNLDEIQGFMMDHIETHIDLDSLARCAGLSRFRFADKYKQLTGYPPIKHFIHMKIEHACYLLDNSIDPVSKIAERLGYEDPLYFSRIFRKTMGLSPRQYRSQRT